MKTLVALLAALGVAALSTAALAQEDCESGTHWDEDSQACVPDEG
jgi:hypothetical protein